VSQHAALRGGPQINEAMDRMKSGKARYRVVLDMAAPGESTRVRCDALCSLFSCCKLLQVQLYPSRPVRMHSRGWGLQNQNRF
jgi:hypothetical protein